MPDLSPESDEYVDTPWGAVHHRYCYTSQVLRVWAECSPVVSELPPEDLREFALTMWEINQLPEV